MHMNVDYIHLFLKDHASVFDWHNVGYVHLFLRSVTTGTVDGKYAIWNFLDACMFYNSSFYQMFQI